MRVEMYADSKKEAWDNFVLGSKNGTFLFLRDYMDYHRDRFVDHSLVVSLDDGTPLSLLPANRVADTLVSHGGLTYGGVVSLPPGRYVPPPLVGFTAPSFFPQQNN